MKNILKRTVAITLSLAMAIGSVIIPTSNKGVHTVYAHDSIQSTSDTTSIVNDVTISSDNSMGNLLAQKLDTVTTQQEENNGYNVFEVEVDGITVTASLETLSDCQLVVGIYSEDGTQLKAMGKCDVNENSEKVQFSLDANLMPKYFLVKAYLIDDTMSPLCSAYESTVYTQEMQEFLSKTTDDFAQDKVLNLDDDKTNNFAVYKDTVQRITSDITRNKVVSVDDTNGVYVFENVDDTIKNLQAGDIFSCTNNGEEIIVKVSGVNVNGTKATVYSDETSLEEVFDYVKIDNQQDIQKAIFDTSDMQEGVIFNGVTDYKKDTEYQSDDYEIAQYSNEEGSSKSSKNNTLELGGEYDGEAEFKLENTPVTIDDDNFISIKGAIKFASNASAKVYITLKYQYLEVKIDYSAKISLGLEEKLNGKIKLCEIGFDICPGFYIGFVPSIIVEADIKLEVSGKLDGQIGFKYGSEKGFENISSMPKFSSKIDIEGTFYIGFSMEPKVTILTEKISTAWIKASVGVEIKASIDSDKGEEEKYVHDCVTCIKGEIYAKANISAGAKFLNSDKHELKVTLLNIEKIPIADFYYSPTFNDGGWGKCKHYRYKLHCVIFSDIQEQLFNVEIQVDGQDMYSTENESSVDIYLSNGEHELKYSTIGYRTKTKKVKVNGETQIDYTWLSKLDNNNDGNKDDNNDTGNDDNKGDDSNKDDNNQEDDSIINQTVSLGQYNSAAITSDGKLYVWGQKVYSTVPEEIMDNVKSVEVQGDRIAVITEDDELYMSALYSATLNKIMDNVKCISLGSNYEAIITNDGELYTAGQNNYGQLGNGTNEFEDNLVKIMDNVKKVIASGSMTAAITKDGELYTWGDNRHGQLGDGTENNSNRPIKIMDNVKDVTVQKGWHNALITTTGELYIWGYYFTENGVEYTSNIPKKILEDVESVDVGGFMSTAINKKGELYTWGLFYLGNGKQWYYENKFGPTKIMDNVKKVCNNSDNFIGAITTTGELYVWGKMYGLNKPKKIMDNVADIITNNHYDTTIAAVKCDGSLYMWGNNAYGNLGNGTKKTSKEPIKVLYNVKLPTTRMLSNDIQQVNNEVTIQQSTDTTSPISIQLVSEVPTNTYSDLTPNAEYMLYVVNSDESGTDILNADNILYINQAKADESGNITFPDFVNSSWNNAKVLLIGGADNGVILDDTGIITGIPSQTTVAAIKSQLHRRFVVFDSGFSEVNDNAYISTGYALGMLDSKGQIVKSYLVSVKGDLDGNGIIDVLDMEAAQKHILGIKKLTGVYEQAGLIINSDDISVLDMEAIQKDILGIEKIAG